MIFIDYLYYQIVNFYQHFNKDGAEKGYAIVMVCGLPFLNIIFILMTLDHFYGTDILPTNEYYILIYSLPIILLIGLRYWKFTSYEEIKERIQNFGKTTRIIADILSIIYTTISLLGFIFFSLYLGSLKNTL